MLRKTPYEFRLKLQRALPLVYRLLAAVLLAGVSVFWGFSTPNGFLKAANIRVVDSLPDIAPSTSQPFLDAESLLATIPYSRANDDSPWNIGLDDRVHLVFKEGHGNCSYKSRALARVLQLRSIPFRIIWIMDRFAVSSGIGHTVVECPVELSGFKGMAIIDMLEGGIPMRGDAPVLLGDLLKHREIPNFRIMRLNAEVDEASVYYGARLEDTVIGVSLGSDYEVYYDFLSRFHVNVGYHRVEKLVYNLGAIVLGLFPPVYVSREEVQRYGSGFLLEIGVARILIWTTRILLLLAIADATFRLSTVIKNRTARTRNPRTTLPAPPP